MLDRIVLQELPEVTSQALEDPEGHMESGKGCSAENSSGLQKGCGFETHELVQNDLTQSIWIERYSSF